MIKPIELSQLARKLAPADRYSFASLIQWYRVTTLRPNWVEERRITDRWDEPAIQEHLNALAAQGSDSHA
jgi:hypothetical protein